MSSKIGNRRHLHSTALGKVFLAGLPDKEFLRLILQGEKQQEVFAQALIRYDPIKHAGREIKNVKARLLRKLQALAEEMGYEANDLISE